MLLLRVPYCLDAKMRAATANMSKRETSAVLAPENVKGRVYLPRDRLALRN